MLGFTMLYLSRNNNYIVQTNYMLIGLQTAHQCIYITHIQYIGLRPWSTLWSAKIFYNGSFRFVDNIKFNCKTCTIKSKTMAAMSTMHTNIQNDCVYFQFLVQGHKCLCESCKRFTILTTFHTPYVTDCLALYKDHCHQLIFTQIFVFWCHACHNKQINKI